MKKIESSGYPTDDGKRWVDLLAREMFSYLRIMKEYKPFEDYLKKLATSIDELRVAYIKELVYRWNAEHRIESLTEKQDKINKRLEKFSGKKVSKENEDIYKEIEDVHRMLNEEGLDISWTNATKKIARKHRKQFKLLYPAFMKWKNRNYAKSK
jgi:predicted phage gp36 major capsid-like protein